jgi:hypothetical protein
VLIGRGSRGRGISAGGDWRPRNQTRTIRPTVAVPGGTALRDERHREERQAAGARDAAGLIDGQDRRQQCAKPLNPPTLPFGVPAELATNSTPLVMKVGLPGKE